MNKGSKAPPNRIALLGFELSDMKCEQDGRKSDGASEDSDHFFEREIEVFNGNACCNAHNI